MSVLFGHPTGNPNSHQAALAHFEAGQLEAFCVPWMPSNSTLWMLGLIGPLHSMTQRLGRRQFPPLARASKVQGRFREWGRLASRAIGYGDERLIHDANDWLMQTMRRECRRPTVTAVHSYEDCSLWAFDEAKRLGKACIYDLPTAYYAAWAPTQLALNQRYNDWLPERWVSSSRQLRADQKRKEIEKADIVLVASRFVEKTIREFYPNKPVALAPYGVDLEFWTPPAKKPKSDKIRFIYAGQISVRKGIPTLIEAWEKAALRDAELELVGSWQLLDRRLQALPSGIIHRPPCAPFALRERYYQADVLVFPSFFEGFGLVLLEAMACGLPAIASETSAAPEIIVPGCGCIVPAGNVDAMVESLRWFGAHRGDLPAMTKVARATVEVCNWERYRKLVTQSVSPYV